VPGRGGEPLHGFLGIDVGSAAVGDRGREFEVADSRRCGEGTVVLGRGAESDGRPAVETCSVRRAEAGTECGGDGKYRGGEEAGRAGGGRRRGVSSHAGEATESRRPVGNSLVNVADRAGDRAENRAGHPAKPTKSRALR